MPRFFPILVLAGAPALVWGCLAYAGEKEPRVKGPDAAAITRLIEQLGSPTFAEREKAVSSLEAIGAPALGALRKAVKSSDPEVARRATALVEVIENTLEYSLAEYRRYGLPLPPADAPLVRFESGGRHVLNGKLMPPTYLLGFMLRRGTKEAPPVLLVGTEEVALRAYQTIEIVKPTPELVKGLDLGWWRPSTFRSNAGLAIALQCKARGWDALAQKLWTLSLQEDIGHHFGAFYHPANLSNSAAVAYLAWAHSGNELVSADTDRTRTAQRMKAVIAAEPRLNTEVNLALLKSVEATLVPSKAKTGTVEWLIDDLTDLCDKDRGEDQFAPHYLRLAQMGFDAVPVLLEHLDDDRLTRTGTPGFNNSPPWILRVNQVVSGLLQQLAGEDVGKDWLQRKKGVVERADAQAWWEKARKVGEDAYLVAHVLPPGEAQWPNQVMLEIITKKYPQHLPKLYRTILDERTKMQSWPVAEAVARSALPKDKKRGLFLHASHCKDLGHRRFGIEHLQKLDPKQFITNLLETLEALPKTPTEPYWSCPEVGFVHLVLATDDPRAWKLLEKVARRSDVGLRMELLNRMAYAHFGDRQLQQRLRLLAAFLDDADAPDVSANPAMFSGPHAGFTFRRLSVRDLAAMELAVLLEIQERPDRDWTPEQWEKLRNKVKATLKR
jgi:hypothetical protein